MAKSSSSEKDFGKNKTSFANMPQEVVMREYPKQNAVNSDLDDTISGIDEVVEHGKGKIRKYPSYQK
jgi:hypothetical protein